MPTATPGPNVNANAGGGGNGKECVRVVAIEDGGAPQWGRRPAGSGTVGAA